MTKSKALRLIKQTNGKIFKALFVKRTTGELREMICRTNVKSYRKGGSLSFNPTEKGLAVVFDMKKKEYRMINLDTIIELKINGKIYR